MSNFFDQFDEATPAKGGNFFDQFDVPEKAVEGGFVASVKSGVGAAIRGAGQAAGDFIPGVDKDNALKRYGQSVIEANPTAVRSLEDIADKPLTAVKEATGNAGGSVAQMLGARAVGQGITALAPFTGPAAPVTALVGQAIAWFGPVAIAALPSYGGIREKQVLNDPENEASWKAKAVASLGAAAVGAIETKFGPQEWALSAMTKEGRTALAAKFAATTLGGSIAKAAGKGALIEGAEELAQNPIEQVAAGDDPTSRESLKETAFGGAMGTIGGGVLGGGFGLTGDTKPKGRPDPIPAILGAPDVDTAINAAQVALSEPADLLQGQPQDPLQAAMREREANPPVFAPANDAEALLNRQGLGDPLAPMLEDRRVRGEAFHAVEAAAEQRKAAELDAIPEQAAQQNTVQAALERAGTVEAPTAMQLALKRARVASAPAIEAAVPDRAAEAVLGQITPDNLPRVVPRAEGMVALPQRLAEQRAAANPAMEVVRIQNQSGKFAYTVIPKEADVRANSNLQSVVAGAAGSGVSQPAVGLDAGVGTADVAGPAVDAGRAGDQSVGQPVSLGNASGEPLATWFGRRGDGYVTEADAKMALPSRQRVEPDLTWKVEALPTGKFRLAGYASADVKLGDGLNGKLPIRSEAAPVAGASDAVPEGRMESAGPVVGANGASAVPASGLESERRPGLQGLGQSDASASAGSAGQSAEAGTALPDAATQVTQTPPSSGVSASVEIDALGERLAAGNREFVAEQKAAREKDAGYRAPDDVGAALRKIGAKPTSTLKETEWQMPTRVGNLGDVEVSIDPATHEATVNALYMGKVLDTRKAQGAAAIAAAVERARDGVEQGTMQMARDHFANTRGLPGAGPAVEALGATGGPGRAGGRNARSRAYDANPFKAFLGKHGLSPDLAAEFAPGARERRGAMVQGYGPIFRSTGKQIDALAQAAHEDGFIPTADADQLYDLIARALRGERIAPLYAEGVAETEMQARVDRQRDMESEAVAALDDLEDNELFELDDAPALDAPSNTTTEAAMRAMGFTEQEISDAVAKESRGPQADSESRGGFEQAPAGPQESAGTGGNQEARAGREGLTRPTPAEVIAQQDRAANAPALDAKAQIDREAADQTLTAQDAPEQRSDNSGDMFAREKAEAEIDQRNAGKEQEADPNQEAMFKRSDTSGPTLRVTQIQRAVDKLTLNWLKKPDIHILDSMQDAPEPVRQVLEQQNSQGAIGDIEGFHWKGGVYLVADQLRSGSDVIRVLYHESLGHFGLRNVYGKDLDIVLRQVALAKRKELIAKAEQYGFDLTNERQRMSAAEEILAEMAQSRPENTLVQRAIAIVRKFLRENVPGFADMKLTDAEIVQQFLVPAREFVENGKRTEPAFMRVGDDPQALRVFHGSPHEFDKFSTDAMGTGEGAQAFGWGLYFAGKREVADYYRTALVQRDPQRLTLDGKKIDPDSMLGRAVEDMPKIGKDAVLKKLDDNIRFNEKYAPDVAEGYRTVRAQIEGLSPERISVKNGKLYEVEIPEDGEYLLWDKPLSEQPEKVKDALKGLAIPAKARDALQNWANVGAAYMKSGEMTGHGLYQLLTEGGYGYMRDVLPNPGQESASKLLHSLGIAGIKYLDGSSRSAGEGAYNYVVFNDEAVKIEAMFSRSVVTGQTNRTYSPEQKRAMRNVGFEVDEPTMKERAQALWQDAGKKLAQGIVDQFAPVKDMDKQAYGLLRLAKGASGAFESFLRGGQLKLTDGVYDFDDTKRGGVVDRLLIPLQGEHHDFFRWIAANRAERLLAEGREHLFTAQDIADLKTLANGTTSFDYTIQTGPRAGTVTRDRTKVYADSQRIFNEFNKNALDMAEQSGLIDPESRRLWEAEFYVPFYRVADDADGGVRGMNIKGGVVRQQAFKQLKGGKGALNADLLDNTLMNWAHLLDAAAKNRAAKATLEAAERMGVAINAPQYTAGQIASATGNKNGVVWFMDGGTQRFFVVDDPYILTALTSLEYAGMRNPVMNAMSTFKHALTVGVTASPFFKVRNLIRDSVQVIGTSSISPNALGNVAEGWKLTDPKSDEYFRLLAGGGTIHFGTMLEGSEAKRVQSLVESGVKDSTILNSDSKVKAFYRQFIEPSITAYNELGNRGEAINRASLYKQLMAQGMTHAEASLQARDLMDFSMQGSFTTIRFLTQVVPFFNARLQGSYKLGRAAMENPARFSAVLGATALFSLALLAAYSDDDDWKKREEWDRNNFWWFKFGGTAFRIPKPFEIGAIATVAERGAELFFDKEMTGKRFRQQVMTLLGDNLSMNPVPQLVKPILDVYSNKNSFSGRPIETMGMERLKSEYRFTDRTSMTARAASTGLNAVTGLVGAEALSPVQIDSLIRGYFGWLGAFVVGAGDVIARPATGQAKHPTPDYWKTATGGMVSDLSDAPSRYVSQMYEQAREIKQAYGTWRALQKEGKTAEAKEFFEDNKDSLVKYRKVEDITRGEARFNERIRMIERSNIPADQKRDLIRTIRDQKDRLARLAV